MTCWMNCDVNTCNPLPLLILILSFLWMGMEIGFTENNPVPLSDSTDRKISFLPHWVPQAQFAGYYMAVEKGIYKKFHLDVAIQRGGPEYPALEALESGKVDFVSTFLSSAIERRAKGIRIFNIGQLVQKSSLILVTRKSSGISKPEDLNGKKISIWPDFAVQPQALFRKYNLNVTVVPQTLTLNLFLHNGVDVASAMWYNEYHTILNSGLNEDELTIFFYDEYGLNFPEDGIYCLEKTLQNNCQLCRDFVQATFEGWQYAFAHTDETLDVVISQIRLANLPTNRVHQQWMLARMKDIILPPGQDIPMGRLRRNDYNTVASELLQNQIITTIPDYSEFYENCATQPQKN